MCATKAFLKRNYVYLFVFRLSSSCFFFCWLCILKKKLSSRVFLYISLCTCICKCVYVMSHARLDIFCGTGVGGKLSLIRVKYFMGATVSKLTTPKMMVCVSRESNGIFEIYILYNQQDNQKHTKVCFYLFFRS